jgi:hypothetical protein
MTHQPRPDDDLHTIMHRRADMAALRRKTRIALAACAIIAGTLMAGVWIGQGMTEFNHIRLEQEE